MYIEIIAAASESEFSALPFIIGAIVMGILVIILRINIIHERNKLLPPLYPEQPEELPLSSSSAETANEELPKRKEESEPSSPLDLNQCETEQEDSPTEEDMELICRACGNKLVPKSVFCHICGERVK